MCGIAGIVAHQAERHRDALEAMHGRIAHRGPDGTGFHFFSDCAFAHARLSIIDLEAGAQPLLYAQPERADKVRSGVVFNGEIYNYREIRSAYNLECRTNADTEVIPALYHKLGDDFCRHLIGMFAFALWDEKNQRLVCARDRFGEKPFYYAITHNNEFIFASEVQAIIASGLVRPILNPGAVSSYLTLRYIPEHISIYKEVWQLEPGSMLIWENGRVTVTRYWELPAQLPSPPTLREAAEELGRLTRQAVSRCLVSDVEVGLLLSGGLDSTTIAALTSDITTLRAFSFGFRGARDERPYAREAALYYGLPYVEMTDDELDPSYLLLKMIEVYGEPFADPSAPAMFSLCNNVSRHVKVALSGDGADELLGGYDSWYQPMLALESGADDARFAVANAHWRTLSAFSPEEIAGLGLPAVDRVYPPHLSGSVDDALRMDLASFLPSDILRKTDRAAMHNGLELRAPFLDAELASFLISLPPAYKVTLKTTKLLMRQAFARLWPPSIIKRAKQGFGFNVRSWLDRPDVGIMRQYYLAQPQRKIFSLFPKHMLGRMAVNNGTMGWHFLILSVWLEHSPWEWPSS